MITQEIYVAADQAEAYINTIEATFINTLFSWESSAQHRAVGCACLQCVREAKRASFAISQELSRVNPQSWEKETYED